MYLYYDSSYVQLLYVTHFTARGYQTLFSELSLVAKKYSAEHAFHRLVFSDSICIFNIIQIIT